METKVLERHFEKMGARAVVSEKPGRFGSNRVSLDIGIDHEGEYFYLGLPKQEAEVLNVDAKDRHLLLMIRDGQQKSKYLCGHDERHWFIAAIPEDAKATTVAQAKEALKPVDLPKFRPWIRQGEWFFVPRPELRLPRNAATFHDEPLVRRTRDGRGGKPHIATECYRHGGTSVHVHQKFAPQGFTKEDFTKWCYENPKLFAKHAAEFRMMARDATVYVRGEIRHPDHATVKLGVVWHRVLMNRENESLAMASMVFLD